MKNKIQEQHSTSIRLPTELHEWVVSYASKWRTSPAYIYRHALWKFKESVINGSR
jgi:predicted transcriptional regulator